MVAVNGTVAAGRGTVAGGICNGTVAAGRGTVAGDVCNGTVAAGCGTVAGGVCATRTSFYTRLSSTKCSIATKLPLTNQIPCRIQTTSVCVFVFVF